MNRSDSIDFSPVTAPMRRSLWLIYLAAAVILLLLLGRNSLVGAEGEIAESVRQLLAEKDIFDPEQHCIDHDSSQLWFSRGRMVAALFFGNSEFCIRLLSVSSALFLLGGTMLLARKFFDRRVMYTSAWMLIGSYGFIYWGRFAGGAVTLVAWVVWSLIVLRCSGNNLWWKTGFFLLFFCGCVWWGMHYIAVLPAMAVMAFPQIKLLFKDWKVLPAILIAAIAMLILSFSMIYFPGVPLEAYPERFYRLFKSSFIESWQVAVAGNSAFGVKLLLNLPRMLMPWALPVLCAVVGMICRWRDLTIEHKRMLAGCLVMFLCIGVYPLRYWQYQQCMLPFFMIIGAAGVAGNAGMESWQNIVNKVMNWGAMILCSFAVAVIAVWPLWQMVFKMSMPLWIMLGMPLLGLLGLALIVFDTGSRSSVEKVSGMRGRWSGYTLAWVCLSCAVFSVGIPVLSDYRTGKPFWQECGNYGRQLFAGEVIYYGGEPDAGELFYMDLPNGCTSVGNGDELTAVLSRISGSNAVIIVESGDVGEVVRVLQSTYWHADVDNPLAVESDAMQFTAENSVDFNRRLMLRLFREQRDMDGADNR